MNASKVYVEHLKLQVKDSGMILPGAIAHLHNQGSMNCVHNVKRPVYVPIKLTELPDNFAFFEWDDTIITHEEYDEWEETPI